MKYEGTKKASNDAEVYNFTFGKEELQILLGLTTLAMQNTPKTFDTMTYRGRLKTIHSHMGRVYVEKIKGKTLPTKRTSKFHERIGDGIK